MTRDHTHVQVHVARSLAVATGGGAVAVVTAAEVSTLTTLSSPSLQTARAQSQQIPLQVTQFTDLNLLSFERINHDIWIVFKSNILL